LDGHEKEAKAAPQEQQGLALEIGAPEKSEAYDACDCAKSVADVSH
jgi:hypothetical protein